MRKLLLIYTAVFLLVTTGVFATIKSYTPAPVEIITSYTPSNFCGELQIKGIRRRLRHSKYHVVLLHYLCLRRCNASAEAREAATAKTLQHSNARIVITVDDLATLYTLKQYPSRIHFTGINNSLESYKRIYPTRSHWCGVLEHPDYTLLLQFFDRINYPVQTVGLVYDRNTNTAQFITQMACKQLRSTGVSVLLKPVTTTVDLEEAASDFEREHIDVVITMVLNIYDHGHLLNTDTTSVVVRDIFSDFILVGFNPAMLEDDYELVVSVSFESMGYTVADMALRGECEVVTSPTYIYVNLQQLERFPVLYSNYLLMKREVSRYVKEVVAGTQVCRQLDTNSTGRYVSHTDSSASSTEKSTGE